MMKDETRKDMMEIEKEDWLIIGGSTGLGFSFLKLIFLGDGSSKRGTLNPVPRNVHVVSRSRSRWETHVTFLRAKLLEQFGEEEATARLSRIHYREADFSIEADRLEALHDIFYQRELEASHPGVSLQFSRIFYFPGGGPWGPYAKREWKDHLWAWETTFLAPAQTLFWLSTFQKLPRQFICVGSAVAEAKPDPYAASYSAAKHALKGLISSLVEERLTCDLRLFSPGYMDTTLLPRKAKVRLEYPNLIADPDEAAKTLWEWLKRSSNDFHMTYSKT